MKKIILETEENILVEEVKPTDIVLVEKEGAPWGAVAYYDGKWRVSSVAGVSAGISDLSSTLRWCGKNCDFFVWD